MAQEIRVGTLARLTDNFTVTEVLYDEYPHVDSDDFVHFVRGTVVRVLHLFEQDSCGKLAVIYSDVIKEATTCLVDYLEPMKAIYVEPTHQEYIRAGKMIRG
ncbi:hypothetical protein [Bacillus thuringiensis]|uniref:hypothetical protein n=1 Tax=Bacillus thuringiensis TaxID=1428 RepID=UPI0011129CE7|nr:hypothetical protein [Bacillus thuringiensis]QCY65007.1 hypothetical protein FHE73_30590 [Bacillus thuringiensis]